MKKVIIIILSILGTSCAELNNQIDKPKSPIDLSTSATSKTNSVSSEIPKSQLPTKNQNQSNTNSLTEQRIKTLNESNQKLTNSVNNEIEKSKDQIRQDRAISNQKRKEQRDSSNVIKIDQQILAIDQQIEKIEKQNNIIKEMNQLQIAQIKSQGASNADISKIESNLKISTDMFDKTLTNLKETKKQLILNKQKLIN
jgi:hypothetical protein